MLGGLASLLLVQVLVLPALLMATERRRPEPAPDAPGMPRWRPADGSR
jgi:hypothetical protein